MTDYLRRGMAAGLLAGLLAGTFAFFVGEPILERAIHLEEAAAAHGDHSHEPVFDRATQKLGLFFATGLFGVTVGGGFGLVFAYFRNRLTFGTDWMRSISLSATVLAGAFLIPFLKYPANPPGVGEAATIGERTIAYYTMMGLSLLAVLVAWMVAKSLRERKVSAPARHVSVGLALAVIVTVMFLILPAAPDPGGVPAGLLWDFRLSSLGTQVVFWAGLGVLFGLLCERSNRREVL